MSGRHYATPALRKLQTHGCRASPAGSLPPGRPGLSVNHLSAVGACDFGVEQVAVLKRQRCAIDVDHYRHVRMRIKRFAVDVDRCVRIFTR